MAEAENIQSPEPDARGDAHDGAAGPEAPVGIALPAAPEENEVEFDLDGVSLEEPGAGRAAEAAPPRAAPAPPATGAVEPGPSHARGASVLQLTWTQALLLGFLALAPTAALLLFGIPGRQEGAAPAQPPPASAPARLSFGPPKPEPWAEARKRAVRGDYRRAIQGLEEFLGGQEEHLHTGERIDAWLELSDWHNRINDPEGAERYARKVVDLRLAETPIAKFFEWGEELFKDGEGFLQAGQPVEAAERFAQARRHLARFLLQERSMSVSARARIARAHERIGDSLRRQADAGEQFPPPTDPASKADERRP